MSNSPFLTLISDTMFERRYAKRTIETDLIWIKWFIFTIKNALLKYGDTKVDAYLNELVIS